MTIRIACVTPWEVRCGIYTYTKDLVYALAEEDIETYVVRLPRFGHKTREILIDIADRIPYDKVDLVHVQHEYGLYQGFDPVFFTALRTHGKPIVTTMHAVGNWEIDVLASGVSNKVIVHNEYCAKRFPFPNTVIIPHGVTPAEPTERAQAKKTFHISPEVPTVGYLGFISNYKGIENLITAMTKVEKTALIICGGWHTDVPNDYIERLRKWSHELLGNRVMWTGFIPEEKLADAYGAMDVLVYPSRFATESGALLHGIAYGKAIIASNIEPFKEKEKEDALMTFTDADDLAKKINNLLGDGLLRLLFEKNARDYAEKNSWKEVAKKHADLYSQLHV